MGRPQALAAAVALVACMLLGGCGEEGVAEDATLSVYVSQPLCGETRQVLSRSDGRAAGYQLRTVCIDDDAGLGEDRLGAIGAAARRATEDSAAIAYIGTPDPLAARFSEPILEAADLPRVSHRFGAAATVRLVRALREADSGGSLREAVADELLSDPR